MAEAVRVLGFAGSLRAGSFNRALLRAATELAPEGMTVEAFDIGAIPLYNGDVEAAGDPAPVTAFKTAIRAADGVLIVTPEYNYSVPGVIKNAIDWASRPPRDPCLGEKPVGVIGASAGMIGTARSQAHMRQILAATNSYCLPQPQVTVANAAEKFDAAGTLTDERTRAALQKYLVAFHAWVQRFRNG